MVAPHDFILTEEMNSALLNRDVARLLVHACKPEDAVRLCRVSRAFWRCGVNWERIRVHAVRMRMRRLCEGTAKIMLQISSNECSSYRGVGAQCKHCFGVTEAARITIHNPKLCPLAPIECPTCKVRMPQVRYHYQHVIYPMDYCKPTLWTRSRNVLSRLMPGITIWRLFLLLFLVIGLIKNGT